VNREPRVLFVGRLVEKKGCEFLIRAFAQVTKVVAHACLVIVGEGELRPQLETLANVLGVPVQFRGGLSSAEVQGELQLAKVFCLPSVTAANGDAEGLPIVLLEAQASGVPVVTSAKGGSGEGIRDGVTGLSFAERDTDALASCLIRLLTDDMTLRAMAFEGPRFVSQSFDLSLCTDALEELYDNIVARNCMTAHHPSANVPDFT
jgi:glycosyltransferase involved in cell wall biosynthesis